MLRRILCWIGAVSLIFGLLAAMHGIPGGWTAAGFGGFLLLALLVERSSYKRVQDAVPGPDWQPTGERFLEPGSDMPVAVYFHPSTGKRIYVRAPALNAPSAP